MDAVYPIQGIHHSSLIASNASRTTHFYTQVLGMDFVKKTVNFDSPDMYHLYFGRDAGTPGTLVTFFVWLGAPPTRLGIGSVHHLALTVDSMDALLKWKTWLQHHHMLVAGPFDQQAYQSIVFTDPDGVVLEIATRGPGWQQLGEARGFLPDEGEAALETWPEPITELSDDMRLGKLHHIAAISSDIQKTNDFYEGLLCIPRLSATLDPDSHDAPRWFWSTARGADAGQPGTVITYVEHDPTTPPIHGQVGHGAMHHFAFEVTDDDALRYWRERVVEHGLNVTEILDRRYFHSIYFHDPDRVLVEIATAGPGFLVDQQADRLGKDLALPPWLEPERSTLEAELPPIQEVP
ncbi:MAG TPA: VOC family protein [Chloroflexota bacterium]